MIIKKIFFSIIYLLLFTYLLIFIPIIWGYKPLVIISGSMEPTLRVGGILYYKQINCNKLKKNDIVVFKSNKYIISHRINNITNEGFITKGDANKNVDLSKVNKSSILGKGTNWSIPYIGYYADFIFNNKKYIKITFILIVIDYIISSLRGAENEKNNKNITSSNNSY